MNKYDQERLQKLRRHYKSTSKGIDISSWEGPFFLRIIDEKEAEIRRLKAKK